MKFQFSTKTGNQLYNLLPAVYRERDNDDLAKYLDACGTLLDQVRNTLDQRLADAFPDNPEQSTERGCQDWILPYFAELLDVRLVSPHLRGRREEVINAVAWRQRKGTAVGIETLVEAVGQMSAEVHEGFHRLATTARLDLPLLPAQSFGADSEPQKNNPLEMARHPGLISITPNISRPSRAIESKKNIASQRTTKFPSGEIDWYFSQPHGTPCFPNSYEDHTRRTVDLRTLNWKHGHYHPKTVLLYVPPPTGFFTTDQNRFRWSERGAHPELITEQQSSGSLSLYNPSWLNQEQEREVATITTRPPPFSAEHQVNIEGLNFLDTITINAGQLRLRNVAAHRLVVRSPAGTQPVLDAKDCLFDSIEVDHGVARLAHCTVMNDISCPILQASDCIFMGDVTLNPPVGNQLPAMCIRYSRLPLTIQEQLHDAREAYANTTDTPVFFDFKSCDVNGVEQSAKELGQPGYGVLHPATPASICFGAEDGGEMGAFHHRYYCLQAAAVLDKVKDFLPLGLEAILIPDRRLLQPPLRQPE